MAKKILVVDDEKDLVNFISARLRANGYNVVVAYDGMEALQKANEEKPDLMLLDVMMPAGDGFSVCQKLKSQDETMNIPVIFLTAKILDRDERLGLGLGAEYYLKKPFEAKELLDVISRVLESPQGIKEEVEHKKIWRFLLVTDNVDVLQMLDPKLKEENFQYQAAESGEEVVNKLNVFNPQLIVFDIYIKNCDGLELLKELAETDEFKKIPLLLLGSPGDKAKLNEYFKITPVLDVVENPYNIAELIQTIKQHFK